MTRSTEVKIKEESLLRDEDLIPVMRREDIPQFNNEDEEAEFWATHDLAGELLAEMRRVPPDDDDELPATRPPHTEAKA